MQGNRQVGRFSSPATKRLSKYSQENCISRATYSGILGKTFFYFLTIAIGITLAFILNSIAPFWTDGYFTISMVAAIAVIPMLLIEIVCPFIAVLLPKTAHVTGSLFCIATGYILTFSSLVIPEYGGLVLLALMITIVLVAVLAVLYAKRVIKVTQRFRAIAFSALITMCIVSLITFILSFIPFVSNLLAIVYNNLAFTLLFGFLGIIIACMFILSDFNQIELTVENGLDKKYEWTASFSLVFSIIWLYFKILDLILTIYNRKN